MGKVAACRDCSLVLLVKLWMKITMRAIDAPQPLTVSGIRSWQDLVVYRYIHKRSQKYNCDRDFPPDRGLQLRNLYISDDGLGKAD